MENMAAKVTAAYFDSKECHYDRVGDNGEALISGFAMKNKMDGTKIFMVFSENCDNVKLATFGLAKVPEEKKPAVYKACNELNAKYRWVKFYVNEEENTIIAQDDAVIQLDSCGAEVFRCCLQLVEIADIAYPILMKAIFA